MDRRINPLEEIGSEWFVNRKEELDYFWKWGNRIPLGGRHSVAFAGLRRTGKTAIIHRVFNRLFHEQDRVMPVFISFEDYLYRPDPMTTYEFAQDYFSGYLRSYFAFRYRRPEFHRDVIELEHLRRFAQETEDELALGLIKSYDIVLNAQSGNPSIQAARWVINFPKGKAYTQNMPTAMFIDEFQLLTNVYNPDDGRTYPLSNYYQKASETLWAPIVVSGSSVSLLTGRATGGALSGRLRYKTLGPLEKGHAVDMVMRLGNFIGVTVTDEFALTIWALTQGYPYAIESLMLSVSPAVRRYPDPDALDEVLSFELTNPNGLLFKHYHEEFSKYTTLLNDGMTTKKVMFWATKYPGEEIDAKRIASEIGVEWEAVQESLEKLEQLDVVQRTTWILYDGPTDPMLRRYIGFRHTREIEGLTKPQATANLQRQINQDRGAESNVVGKLAEIVVAAVMRCFDGRMLDGERYFSYPEPVTTPKFWQLERRWGVLEDDRLKELDLIGEYPVEGEEIGERRTAAWLVQVKYRKRTASRSDVEAFLAQIDAAQGVKDYVEVTYWFFSKGGFTEPAKELLRASGIYFSDLAQFNRLAQEFDFLGFPR